MRLEVDEVVGRHPGAGVGLPQQGLLGGGVGHGQAGGAPVAVRAGGQDHGMDAVAVGQRVGQPFEQHGAAALGADVAVGGGGEGAAAPGGGEHGGGGEADVRRGAEQDADAAHEGGARTSGPQVPAGQVQGGEGRGARGVDGRALAVPVQGVGDAVGRVGRRAARHGPGVDAVGVGGLEVGVVVAGNADENRGVRAGQGRPVLPGVVQCFDREFEKQTLLRVDTRCLARGDAEEFRVECPDVVEESARRGDAAAGPRSAGVDEPPGVEPVRRHRGHHVPALFQDVPQPGQVVGAPGHPACGAHDRDGVFFLCHSVCHGCVSTLTDVEHR